MSYIIYAAGITREGNAYGVLDMQGPQPGSMQDCEALAGEIRVQHPAATVMVVPFGRYVSTANQFVVKETGTYEGKPNTVRYFGPFATKADAEGGQRALAPGGGHEDMQSPIFEILRVTAAELATMAVEALPE
jgi:hypothetical protein